MKNIKRSKLWSGLALFILLSALLSVHPLRANDDNLDLDSSEIAVTTIEDNEESAVDEGGSQGEDLSIYNDSDTIIAE